jgi:hypothetical protein
VWPLLTKKSLKVWRTLAPDHSIASPAIVSSCARGAGQRPSAWGGAAGGPAIPQRGALRRDARGCAAAHRPVRTQSSAQPARGGREAGRWRPPRAIALQRLAALPPWPARARRRAAASCHAAGVLLRRAAPRQGARRAHAGRAAARAKTHLLAGALGRGGVAARRIVGGAQAMLRARPGALAARGLGQSRWASEQRWVSSSAQQSRSAGSGERRPAADVPARPLVLD